MNNGPEPMWENDWQPPPARYSTPYVPGSEEKGGSFAVAALVLGLAGLVLSVMPIINNLAIAGGVVGFVLGWVGISKARPWMSAFGIVLCAAAVVVSLVMQAHWAEELDRIFTPTDPVHVGP